jgi:zinc protease
VALALRSRTAIWKSRWSATSIRRRSAGGRRDVSAACPRATRQSRVHRAAPGAFPAARELKNFDFQSRDPKAYAVVYWPTTDFGHVSEVRRLFVLAKVLEGRILQRIRDQQGLSYAVQSAHAPSNAFPDYGTLFALVDASPVTAQRLALQIREIAGELANGSITQDELDRARNPIVNELKKLLMDNHYLMSAVVGPSQEQPQRLERATTSVQELESLTVEQVQGVAKKYLQPGDGLPVVVVPVNGEKKSARPVADRAAALSH